MFDRGQIPSVESHKTGFALLWEFVELNEKRLASLFGRVLKLT